MPTRRKTYSRTAEHRPRQRPRPGPRGRGTPKSRVGDHVDRRRQAAALVFHRERRPAAAPRRRTPKPSPADRLLRDHDGAKLAAGRTATTRRTESCYGAGHRTPRAHGPTAMPTSADNAALDESRIRSPLFTRKRSTCGAAGPTARHRDSRGDHRYCCRCSFVTGRDGDPRRCRRCATSPTRCVPVIGRARERHDPRDRQLSPRTGPRIRRHWRESSAERRDPPGRIRQRARRSG